jgi:hypothetical protein
MSIHCIHKYHSRYISDDVAEISQILHEIQIDLSPTFIHLSKVDTTCFSPCCDESLSQYGGKHVKLFLGPAACLALTLLGNEVGTND